MASIIIVIITIFYTASKFGLKFDFVKQVWTKYVNIYSNDIFIEISEHWFVIAMMWIIEIWIVKISRAMLYPQEYKTHRESFIKRFEITKLPPYLILFIKVLHCALMFWFICNTIWIIIIAIYKEQFLHWEKPHYSKFPYSVRTSSYTTYVTIVNIQGYWYGRISVQWSWYTERTPTYHLWSISQHLSWWTSWLVYVCVCVCWCCVIPNTVLTLCVFLTLC